MAFTTPNVRIESMTFRFFAVCFNSNSLLEKWESSFQARLEDQGRARVRKGNLRHRAGKTIVLFPFQRRGRIRKQPAFFACSSSKIISKKITTLFTGRSFHVKYYSIQGNDLKKLCAGDVTA